MSAYRLPGEREPDDEDPLDARPWSMAYAVVGLLVALRCLISHDWRVPIFALEGVRPVSFQDVMDRWARWGRFPYGPIDARVDHAECARCGRRIDFSDDRPRRSSSRRVPLRKPVCAPPGRRCWRAACPGCGAALRAAEAEAERMRRVLATTPYPDAYREWDDDDDGTDGGRRGDAGGL